VEPREAERARGGEARVKRAVPRRCAPRRRTETIRRVPTASRRREHVRECWFFSARLQTDDRRVTLNRAQRGRWEVKAPAAGAACHFSRPFDRSTRLLSPTLAMSNPVVFFDMTIGGEPAGRIEMTLRQDVTPKTAGASLPRSRRPIGVRSEVPPTIAIEISSRARPTRARVAPPPIATRRALRALRSSRPPRRRPTPAARPRSVATGLLDRPAAQILFSLASPRRTPQTGPPLISALH
jgi:hypothetical protein